jgi:Domain of unknown function (DUF1744)
MIALPLHNTQSQHNRHVLWASEATHPDIGGSENEENDIWSQELHSTSVCNPGNITVIFSMCTRTLCIYCISAGVLLIHTS